MAIRWARGSYLYAQQMGADKDVLHELAEWIADAKAAEYQDQQKQIKEMQELQAAAAPPIPEQLQPPPALPGGPMAQGTPPPIPGGPIQ